MRKAFLICILILMASSLGAQFPRQTDRLDSTAIQAQGRRWGVVQAVLAESGLWRLMLADSSGILYVTPPEMEYYQCDTVVATTSDDSICAFDRDYEFFMVAAKESWDYQVGFGDTADIYVPGGCVLNLYVPPTDTVWVQCAESGRSTLISVTGFRRKRY